jgi:hypothetical protein
VKIENIEKVSIVIFSQKYVLIDYIIYKIRPSLSKTSLNMDSDINI